MESVHALLKEAARQTALDLILADIYVSERYEVYVKPKFNTACWTYLPPHRIYLGENLFENARPGLTREERIRYAGSLFRHELGHLRFTERDLKRIKVRLASIKAPFGLWNLFEDARIEHKSRVIDKLAFNWLLFEVPGLESSESTPEAQVNGPMWVPLQVRPESILFRLIQAETSDLQHPALQGYLNGQNADTVVLASKVRGFYLRMIAAVDTWALFPILADWLQEFPQSASNSDTNGRLHDLALAEALQNDPDFRAAFEKDADAIDAPPDSGSGSPGDKGNAVPDAGTGDLLASEAKAEPFDRLRAQALAKKLEQVVASASRMQPTSSPSRHLNIKGYALGSTSLYRSRKDEGSRRKRVALVLDCSGSMDGKPMQEGKILIAALNHIAKRGKISGDIILSAVTEGGAKWQRFALPIADAVIDRFQGFGNAEGLEYAIRANEVILRQADTVFVYTDAELCDADVDKARLHQRGLYTVGLYCSDTQESAESLMKYFDQCVVRENVESLLDALFKTLRR